MKNACKSELLKLLTVRSTYVMLALVALFVSGISFWSEYKAQPGMPISHDLLAHTALDSATAIGLFVMVTAVLVVTHEYRYNTIAYTMTRVRRRWHILFAKVSVVLLYSLLFGAIMALLVMSAQALGVMARGDTLPLQTFDVLNLVWRLAFYYAATALFALGVAVIVRSIAVSLVILLAGINIVESLLALVLPHHFQYLPFNALGSILRDAAPDMLEPTRAAVVTCGWLALLWVIAVVTFLRRDAN